MHIALEPVELGFRRPLTQEVIQTLTIKNTHYEPVAFKVKTTAPKQYCVRPNSGRIEAGQSVSVKVLLQAMKEDPPPGHKSRDKFLVQSVAITADKESQSAADIWAYVDKNDKDSIQERKIRVVFLPEEGATLLNIDQPPSGLDSGLETGGTGRPVELDEGRDDYQQVPATATSHISTPSTSPSNNDLAAQLADARQQLALLQKKFAEQEGLRQRNVSGENERQHPGATGGQMATQMQRAPDGVPVKIVAALCFVSFLLALLF